MSPLWTIHLDHLNIVVDDMPRMVAFYQDVLGLQVTKRANIRGAWIEAVTGIADADADVVYLEAAGGSRIELICYRTPKGLHPDGLALPNTRGIRHFAFRVDNLEGVVEAMKRHGIQLQSEPQEVAAGQVDFGSQRKRLVYGYDPEGNLIEFCSYE